MTEITTTLEVMINPLTFHRDPLITPPYLTIEIISTNQTFNLQKWETLLNNTSICTVLFSYLYEKAKTANLIQTPAH
ncbi:44076_t:CDS:2, partial [Gigaspora margarita]